MLFEISTNPFSNAKTNERTNDSLSDCVNETETETVLRHRSFSKLVFLVFFEIQGRENVLREVRMDEARLEFLHALRSDANFTSINTGALSYVSFVSRPSQGERR